MHHGDTESTEAFRILSVSSENLVPGDIVVLAGGDVVMAAIRLVEASKLQADESTLTGESVSVAKQVDAVTEDTPLAKRKSVEGQ